jgi:hypothetical protein
MTKAQDLFEAKRVYDIEDDNLCTFFMDNFFGKAKDYSWDNYDYSLELKYAKDDWAPTPEDLQAVADYGFYLLYVNYEGGEARLYNKLPSDFWGSCCNCNSRGILGS